MLFFLKLTNIQKEGGRMYTVGSYRRIRFDYERNGLSQRELSRKYGFHRDTIRKMLEFSVPPGYQRKIPPARPKLDPFVGVIDAILRATPRLTLARPSL